VVASVTAATGVALEEAAGEPQAVTVVVLLLLLPSSQWHPGPRASPSLGTHRGPVEEQSKLEGQASIFCQHEQPPGNIVITYSHWNSRSPPRWDCNRCRSRMKRSWHHIQHSCHSEQERRLRTGG
jgi:hypothetical protein